MRSSREIHSLQDIKGIHFAGVRSIPKSQRSAYLELYVLDREMDRLGKERFALGKRMNNCQKRLDMISIRKEKLYKQVTEEGEIKVHVGASPRKPLKTMAIRY